MTDRTVGILGGMGPEATLDLYREIISLTPASRDQEHIPVIIHSNTRIPDRTAAILHDGEDPLPELLRSARLLESAGAGILAVPCNTAHHYLPRLEESVSIPVLNMILETLNEFKARLPGAQAAGLLATAGTVESRIYHRLFHSRGIDVLVPVPNEQERVSTAIHRIKAGQRDKPTAAAVRSIGAALIESGAGAVILGCTELPLLMEPESEAYPVLNPTRILAQSAVDWALGKTS